MKRLLFIYLKTLAKGVLLFALILGGCVWLNIASEKSAALRAQRPHPAAVSRISNAELQTLIADVYHVEQSRFIQPDLLWVTLTHGADVQATCQAIANAWAHRSGLAYVRVESWKNNQRLAQATVRNGQPITP